MTVKTLTLVLSLASAGALAGCSSPSVITRDDGGQEVTPDAPEYNQDSGFYEYQRDGRTTRINKDRVDKIEEVDD